MPTRRFAKIAAFALLLFFWSRSAYASSIGDLTVETIVSSFGEQAPAYFGQSFVAEGTALNLAFLLASASGPDATNFRVLITELTGSGASLRPSAVLFESPTLSLPFDFTFPINDGVFTRFDVDLGGLSLTPGKSYAFVLDAFVAYNGIGGSAGSAVNAGYTGGHFFYYRDGVEGNRADHFNNAEGWNFGTTDQRSLAFELSFDQSAHSVPEQTTTLFLLLVSLSSIWLLERRL